MARKHNHAPANYNRAFALGVALNIGYIAVEAAFGILVGSLALLADAGHNLSDVLGLLLAPAVVSFSMGTVLDVVLERLGANPEGPAAIMLTGPVLVVGVGVPYCATVFPGIPYVIALRGQGGLTFRTVMIPTAILSLIDPVFAYLSLCDMHPPHPLAEGAVLPQVLAVILPGLCLYFIGVWKSGKRLRSATR